MKLGREMKPEESNLPMASNRLLKDWTRANLYEHPLFQLSLIILRQKMKVRCCSVSSPGQGTSSRVWNGYVLSSPESIKWYQSTWYHILRNHHDLTDHDLFWTRQWQASHASMGTSWRQWTADDLWITGSKSLFWISDETKLTTLLFKAQSVDMFLLDDGWF